jgi:hypothetical protein
MREKTQADFDLEKLFSYIDEALTSKDERVQSALRSLLTIIELTRPQDDGHMAVETSYGPLRQMQEDLKNITRRLNNLEGEVRQRGTMVSPANPYMPGPYNPGYPVTGTPSMPNPPGAWWGVDPNMPHTTSKTSSSSSYTLTDNEKDALRPQAVKLTK